MTIRSFDDLINTYDTNQLDPDDMLERTNKLSENSHSVIIEGDILEFENVMQWTKLNLGLDFVDYIFFGKIAYDYGFFELFFNQKSHMEKLTSEIPNIYTLFPNGKLMKSKSHDSYVEEE